MGIYMGVVPYQTVRPRLSRYGYELPELRVHEEVVSVDNSTAGTDRDGQVKMFREAALGLADAAKERRDNMQEKIARVVEIINRPENRDDHFLLWHDLENERKALCDAICTRIQAVWFAG